MDIQKLDERIMELIDSAKFEDAERELHERKSDLSGAGADRLVLDHVLSLLVTVNLNKEPRDLAKAESYCLEREQTIGSGYAKLQYAMTLYWSMDDPERTVAKAREAIAKGREESDDKTVYQSLGLLGLALLDLHENDKAIEILDEIGRMVAARLKIVVGDETLFLERLRARTEDPKAKTKIHDIAKQLAPVCRDPEFAARLKTLAS
jgi:hypothetical protein